MRGQTNYLKLFSFINTSAITILSSNPTFLMSIQAILESKLLQDFTAGKLGSNYKFIDDILYFNELIVLPSIALQFSVFHQRHSAPVASHYGLAKTVELISHDFYWPGMRTIIQHFICNCDTCSRAKPSHQAPFGKLPPCLFWPSAGGMYLWISSLTYYPHAPLTPF